MDFASLKSQMDQMYAKMGHKPPDLGGMMGGGAPAADDGEMKIQAPTTQGDGFDVISGGVAPERTAQFRDQPNAHGSEVHQIEQVINELEKSQEEDRRRNSSARISELGLRAGQAASSGIAGLPITEKGPLTPKISLGDQKLQSAKLKEEMKQNLFKRENPEQERMNKLQIEQYRELLRVNEDAEKKAQHEKDKAQQHDEFVAGQSGQDRRAGAGNTTKIAVAEIGAGGSAARGAGEAAARNEYEQGKMGTKRTYDGIKYHAREMVDMNQSNRADHVLETYSMIMPAINELEDMLAQDPRGVAKWGQDARSSLVAAVQQAAEGTTKYNGDGVMNGADQVHAMRQLGSPETFEQMVTANGGAGLAQFKKTIGLQLHSRLQSLGYEAGEGKDNSLDAVHKRAAAKGNAASSKTPRVSAQDALDAQDKALHGKHPTLDEKNPPAPQPSSDDATKLPDRKDPNKGKMIIWSPGSKARIE